MAKLIQITDGSSAIKFAINKAKITIGRDDSNDICIDDVLVSKHHASIEIVVNEELGGAYEYILHDLDSTNNTYVNDQQVNLHRLSEGDVLCIGTHNFIFDDSEDQNLQETAKLHKSWIPGVYYTKTKKKTRKKK